MKSAFEEMMNGLDEVESFLDGNRKGYRVSVPDEVDVKRIRARLNMTQLRFSNLFGFSLDAVKHWEGKRRTPEASARAFLTVIERDPEAVITALHPKGAADYFRHAKHRAGKVRVKPREHAVSAR